MDNLDFSVKYPFTSVAKDIIRNENIALNERIIDLGLTRIKNSITGKLSRPNAIRKEQKLDRIVSYASARMILGYMRNSYVTNKYAVGEAKLASSMLRSESPEVLDTISYEFGIELSSIENGFLIPVFIYLKYSPRSLDYLLINRKLENGKIFIIERERIRLIEEAIRKHVQSIPLVKDPPDEIKNAVEKLKDFLPKTVEKRTDLTFSSGDHPPCVEKLLEALKKHENLPHQARWYLVVYLLARGMSGDDLVSLYSNLPDFSEKITSYQVGHAKKRGYTVPSCATILSYGLCCAECKIGSPINWKKGMVVREFG